MSPRLKPKLSGILPDGTVVTQLVVHGANFRYAIVRGTLIVSGHWDADVAAKRSEPGDVIVGLTLAPIPRDYRRHITTIPTGGLTKDGEPLRRIICLPQCYACEKPGLGRARDREGRWAPACLPRHATEEGR